ncbi:hypothetical protein DFH06DRAFT_1312767 [Mycena polygramma]|nr:hypothetical protein DFH06DRAFT_1312767 [Mycena polygramma]
MSDHSLPDEIISEILSPALKVADDVFSDTSDVSPFANYSESTSAYLLVCKSWLRVATPLLYNVVILRSKAQAKALSLVLNKNKQLGQFIKKLRVEGGYGAPMGIILECSPHISDLFLSFEIFSSDSTNGLCKGLPLINPTRLVLRDSGPSRRRPGNKVLSQLVDGLVKAMHDWDHLVIFHSPYTRRSDTARKVLLVLEKSKRLRTLVVPRADCAAWAYSALKKCPLQAICIQQPISGFERHYVENLTDASLEALLKFRDAPTSAKAKVQEPLELPPSLDPSFTPLAGAPEDVYDTILSRILYFAMSVPELAENPASRGIPPRLPLLLVSKTFNRVGLPSYYAHISLRHLSSILNLASAISTNPSIGAHVRTLGGNFLDSRFGFMEFENDAEKAAAETAMVTVLPKTTGLVRMGRRQDFPNGLTSFHDDPSGEIGISWAGFEAMAECSASTLRELFVRIGTSPQASTAIFRDFTALRRLDLKCESDFVDLENTPADGFPSLEVLRVSLASQSFLIALSMMELPALRHVVLSGGPTGTFMDAHGPKLTELRLPHRTLQRLKIEIFKVCPNLKCMALIFDDYPASEDACFPHANDFYSAQAVPSLVKIVFNMAYWTKSKREITEWGQFFDEFDPGCFPNLREIETSHCEWPKTEREILKSCWVQWAEILLEHNINLTDKTGKKWRPRLQVKK